MKLTPKFLNRSLQRYHDILAELFTLHETGKLCTTTTLPLSFLAGSHLATHHAATATAFLRHFETPTDTTQVEAIKKAIATTLDIKELPNHLGTALEKLTQGDPDIETTTRAIVWGILLTQAQDSLVIGNLQANYAKLHTYARYNVQKLSDILHHKDRQMPIQTELLHFHYHATPNNPCHNPKLGNMVEELFVTACQLPKQPTTGSEHSMRLLLQLANNLLATNQWNPPEIPNVDDNLKQYHKYAKNFPDNLAKPTKTNIQKLVATHKQWLQDNIKYPNLHQAFGYYTVHTIMEHICIMAVLHTMLVSFADNLSELVNQKP